MTVSSVATVDKGTADEASRTILKSLDNPYIALFATLGADPKSPML